MDEMEVREELKSQMKTLWEAKKAGKKLTVIRDDTAVYFLADGEKVAETLQNVDLLECLCYFLGVEKVMDIT